MCLSKVPGFVEERSFKRSFLFRSARMRSMEAAEMDMTLSRVSPERVRSPEASSFGTSQGRAAASLLPQM